MPHCGDEGYRDICRDGDLWIYVMIASDGIRHEGYSLESPK